MIQFDQNRTWKWTLPLNIVNDRYQQISIYNQLKFRALVIIHGMAFRTRRLFGRICCMFSRRHTSAHCEFFVGVCVCRVHLLFMMCTVRVVLAHVLRQGVANERTNANANVNAWQTCQRKLNRWGKQLQPMLCTMCVIIPRHVCVCVHSIRPGICKNASCDLFGYISIPPTNFAVYRMRAACYI